MKILVFNQYYPPDTSATAQRLADLCKGLAHRHEITVVCGRPSYDPMPESPLLSKDGVGLVRVPSTTFHRSWMPGRISNYLTYLAPAFFVGVFQPRPDLVVAMTDPFVVGLIAWLVAFIQRAPFVYIVQDLYPDVLVQLGKVKNRLLTRAIDRMNLFLFRRAEKVVAISLSMKDRLLKKGLDDQKVAVIANWADIAVVEPQPKENHFSLRHRLNDKFVVMYSGNIGLSQSLHFLLESAKRLEELKDLVFVVIGDGAGKPWLVDKARELRLSNVLFFPYQPVGEMRYSFATADVFIVPLAAGFDGLVVPSKVFSIMASGRAFIAAIDETSEVARLAREFACGLVVRPDDAAELTKAISWAYESRAELKAMGEKGRKVAEQCYSKEIGIAQYENVFYQAIQNA